VADFASQIPSIPGPEPGTLRGPAPAVFAAAAPEHLHLRRWLPPWMQPPPHSRRQAAVVASGVSASRHGASPSALRHNRVDAQFGGCPLHHHRSPPSRSHGPPPFAVFPAGTRTAPGPLRRPLVKDTRVGLDSTAMSHNAPTPSVPLSLRTPRRAGIGGPCRAEQGDLPPSLRRPDHPTSAWSRTSASSLRCVLLHVRYVSSPPRSCPNERNESPSAVSFMRSPMSCPVTPSFDVLFINGQPRSSLDDHDMRTAWRKAAARRIRAEP